jgi:hypothetical protein
VTPQEHETSAAVKKTSFLLPPIQQVAEKVPSIRIFAFQGLKPGSFGSTDGTTMAV